MNTTGGPLTYKDKPILVNGAASADIQKFDDVLQGNMHMLHFKKHGIVLPSRIGSDSGTIIGSWTKSYPTPGAYKMVNLVINPACPCEDCNYSYGINIVASHKDPGIFNSQWAPESRFYTGQIPAIGTCNGTALSAADIVTIENDIIDQITNDNGLGTYQGPAANANGVIGAIVEARKFYYFVVSDNNNLSGFTITHADGTTTAYSVDANGVAGAWGAAFNADAAVNTVYKAIRLGTDTYMITTFDAGLKFSLGTLLLGTAATKGINLKSKDINETFYIQYDKGFATATGMFYFEITDSAVTFAQNGLDMLIYIDGALHSETNSTGAGAANAVTDINVAQQTSHDVYGSAPTSTANTTVVIASLADITLAISLDTTTLTTIIITDRNTPSGQFARQTQDDVFREFHNHPFDGTLRSQHRPVLPLADTDYAIFIIRCLQGTYGLHGASHGASYNSEVIAYVKVSEAEAFETILDSWIA